MQAHSQAVFVCHLCDDKRFTPLAAMEHRKLHPSMSRLAVSVRWTCRICHNEIRGDYCHCQDAG